MHSRPQRILYYPQRVLAPAYAESLRATRWIYAESFNRLGLSTKNPFTNLKTYKNNFLEDRARERIDSVLTALITKGFFAQICFPNQILLGRGKNNLAECPGPFDTHPEPSQDRITRRTPRSAIV